MSRPSAFDAAVWASLQHPTANNRSFLSLTLSRRNASIGCGSAHASHSASVIGRPHPVRINMPDPPEGDKPQPSLCRRLERNSPQVCEKLWQLLVVKGVQPARTTQATSSVLPCG